MIGLAEALALVEAAQVADAADVAEATNSPNAADSAESVGAADIYARLPFGDEEWCEWAQSQRTRTLLDVHDIILEELEMRAARGRSIGMVPYDVADCLDSGVQWDIEKAVASDRMRMRAKGILY